MVKGEARQKLADLCKNALDMRNKHEIEVPSRTCTLHLINEAKKQENSLADMAYGERKLLDASDYLFKKSLVSQCCI